MNAPNVVTSAGLTINLAEVKCFHLNNFASSGLGKRNTLIVEFKSRHEYLQHPVSGEFELQEFNDKTEVEFPDYDTAKAYTDEWREIWQNYLDEQS